MSAFDTTSYIMYRVGRKPYLVSRFEEVFQHCKITAPILIGKGHQLGGHHLFLQTLREGGVAEVTFNAESNFEVVATLDGSRVSRYKKRSPMPDTISRMARFYDLRVQIGDLNHYVSSVKLKAKRVDTQVQVEGTVEFFTSTLTEDAVAASRPICLAIDIFTKEDINEEGKFVSLFRGWENTGFAWNEDAQDITDPANYGLSSAPTLREYRRAFIATFAKP